ncbi:MAG TPA: hypothetical protein VM529_15845 [Gemmata sp.]|nr:hypothetical protein [Gemmata sp.]
MTITRILPGLLLVVATAGPALGQFGRGGTAGSTADFIPEVGPTAARPDAGAMPAGRPLGAISSRPTSLERVATQPGLVTAAGVGEQAPAVSADGGYAAGPSLPAGAYPSPYYTDGPGCCGPLGRNGRIGYELYAYTGPAWAVGEGRFARQLQTGWLTGGGGRSLFFNTTHDAAWVVDLGLSYQYNRGSVGHFTELVLRQPPDFFGNPQPDVISPAAVRGLHRTNFNFALGRDWWMWGPGSTGLASGCNVRFGGLVGGRWGTAHVDLLPQDLSLGDYQRRQGVTHGVFVAPQLTVEVPMGASVWFAGLRAEWGYDWMNLVPPLEGNLHSFNLLMTAGIRF